MSIKKDAMCYKTQNFSLSKCLEEVDNTTIIWVFNLSSRSIDGLINVDCRGHMNLIPIILDQAHKVEF